MILAIGTFLFVLGGIAIFLFIIADMSDYKTPPPQKKLLHFCMQMFIPGILLMTISVCVQIFNESGMP